MGAPLLPDLDRLWADAVVSMRSDGIDPVVVLARASANANAWRAAYAEADEDQRRAWDLIGEDEV